MRWVSVCNVFCTISLAVAAAACGGGGGSSSDPNSPGVPQPPVAANDRIRADGSELQAIDVLANDDDPDSDSLSVSIEQAPTIGTATVNDDQSVRIDELPSDFKGATRFTYRVTDPEGASSVAGVAVFVGTAPFSVIFAANSTADASPEVYLTDLAADPELLTAATSGALRLEGFVASPDGGTVVYSRAEPGAANSAELSFVRSANPDEKTRIVFPDGAVPVRDEQGRVQYQVSPNGRWVAAIAASADAKVLYVLDVDDPSTVTRAGPMGAAYMALPRFSQNSDALFFLATTDPDGANRSLYTASPGNPIAAVQVSAPIASAGDDVSEYSVSPDQSRILIQAQRGGRASLRFIDPSQLQVEVQVNHPLLPGENLLESTIGLPPVRGGSARGDRVAYTVRNLLTFSTFEAEVSATPGPHLIAAAGARVVGFRPDDAALLYSRSGAVYESPLDGSGDELVGPGAHGWYDSTGNIVLLKQFLPSGGSPPSYTALAVSVRGSFGSTQQVGTPVLAAQYINVSGIDHGVAIVGEGPTTGAAPSSARLALINALAPETLIYLADFESPLDLASESAQVVDD